MLFREVSPTEDILEKAESGILLKTKNVSSPKNKRM